VLYIQPYFAPVTTATLPLRLEMPVDGFQLSGKNSPISCPQLGCTKCIGRASEEDSEVDRKGKKSGLGPYNMPVNGVAPEMTPWISNRSYIPNQSDHSIDKHITKV
jgi:hypothetical protein